MLESDVLYFYRNRNENIVDDDHCFKFSYNFLQLKLNDLETGNPMFFLSNFKKDGNFIVIDFLNPNDENAEDKNRFYRESNYLFPLMDNLSSNELISTRKELKNTTLDFRKKINEWATICYTNTNANLWLDYFKKTQNPFYKLLKVRF